MMIQPQRTKVNTQYYNFSCGKKCATLSLYNFCANRKVDVVHKSATILPNPIPKVKFLLVADYVPEYCSGSYPNSNMTYRGPH
jgi:hypothetical protein